MRDGYDHVRPSLFILVLFSNIGKIIAPCFCNAPVSFQMKKLDPTQHRFSDFDYWKLDIVCRLLACLFFAIFVFRVWLSLQINFKISSLLILIELGINIVLLLTRRRASLIEVSVYIFAISFLGTVAPMFIMPVPELDDTMVGQCLQVLGLMLEILALLSLNRSFGVLPANRGIRTAGLYRFIRHPLYASYFLSFLGYLFSNPNIVNFIVIIFVAVCQILRLLAEETTLSEDPTYREYASKVRWRLLPGVF